MQRSQAPLIETKHDRFCGERCNTHLVSVEDDEYVSKHAPTLKEACAFIEASYDFVTDILGAKLARKRRQRPLT